MLRRIGVLFALLLLSQALGCAICAAPDDYCGPVPGDGLGFNDRAGSILQGMPPGALNAEIIQDSQGESISTETLEDVQGPPTPAPIPGMGPARPVVGRESRRSLPQQTR